MLAVTPSKRRIYLDHNATTPLDSGIVDQLSIWAQDWGNPSSIHWNGRGPKTSLREARASFAEMIGAQPLEIIYTSGGSEANNLAIQGGLMGLEKLNKNRRTVLISEIEHPSLKRMESLLTSRNYNFVSIRALPNGQIDLEHLQELLQKYNEDVALVSVQLANNETGVIQPVQKVALMAHDFGALVHTDAVQALGRIAIDVKSLGVDYASFSGHKFYALKGIGALYQAKGAPLEPLIIGGGQERFRRGGTENVLGIRSLHFMTQRKIEVLERAARMSALRDRLETQVLKTINNVRINGKDSDRLPSTTSFIIDGVDGESLLMALDIEGVSVSTGAACSSGSPEPSPVLLAMGLTRTEAQSSLRVGIGWSTTRDEIEEFVEILSRIILRLRSVNPSTLSQDIRVQI